MVQYREKPRNTSQPLQSSLCYTQILVIVVVVIVVIIVIIVIIIIIITTIIITITKMEVEDW